LIAEFLDEHLLPCKCAGALHHDRGDHRAALGHLLVVLRAHGVIAVPTVSATPVDEELRRYGEYMEHVRGLAPKTRSIALRIISRLLTARFGEGPSTSPRSSPSTFGVSSRGKRSFIANRRMLGRSWQRCAATSATAPRWAISSTD
jgi:hypothetical protein